MAGGHVKYRALSRSSAHRQALLRNLVTSLFRSESIQTTWHKAKEAQRLAEKLVTMAKKNTVASRRRAHEIFFTPGPLVEKLFGPIRKRYLNRPGGYTRVLRIESPKEDQADAAILELVDGPKDLRFRLTAKTVARQRELMTEAGDQPESMEYATETSSVDEDMPTQTMEPNSKRKAKKAAASAIPTSNPAVSIPQQTMRGLNQLTSMNIKKVTQFRRGGVAEFEQLVTQFQNFHQTLKPRSASLLPSSSSSSSSSSPFSASTKITTKDSITRIADPKIERRLIKEVEVNKGQARVYPVQERGSRGFKGENRERRTQRMKKGEEKAERGRREEEMDRKEENAWKRVRLAAGL